MSEVAYWLKEYISIEGDELVSRPGFITFDDTSHLTDDKPYQGPLHAEHGIYPEYLAAILTVPVHKTVRQRRISEVGYWITSISQFDSGAGVLVGMDNFRERGGIETWGSDRLLQAAHELNIPAEDFMRLGVGGLRQLVTRRRGEH